MRGVIYTQAPGDALLAGRTQRMLVAAGIVEISVIDAGQIVACLASTQEPVWLVRAGCWQSEMRRLREIAPSASGLALAGFGRGGVSCYLEPKAAGYVAESLLRGLEMGAVLGQLPRQKGLRVVPLLDIDVRHDPAPRVLQLVTTIQLGGAERIALDLTEELERAGTTTALAVLGRPTRRAFPSPSRFIDLSDSGFAPQNRAEAVHRAATSFGADVIHAHLIRASEAAAIRALGCPVVISVHNILPSWPEGYVDTEAPFADLMLGCAEAVTRQVETKIPHTVSRTIWNGISLDRVTPTETRRRAGLELREQLCWDASDLVLLAVANPRPQKRLHRLPEIAACLQDLIAPRRVRILLAGEPSAGSADAAQSLGEFHREVESWHLRKAVHWTGPVDDVAPLLAAADIFVAVSALEGLSLAQLEAIAAGLPVVATEVGGAREVAVRSSRVLLLPVSASAEAFAEVLAKVASAPPPRRTSLPREFTRERMGRRTQLALFGLLASRVPARKDGPAAWLIINNLMTGGAQSSARRLVLAMAARGVVLRVATLEEWKDAPSVGTLALRAAGVKVEPIAPSREMEDLVNGLLLAVADEPAETIVFWNVVPGVKFLLTEVLPGARFVDVSPGEMYFTSLEQFCEARFPGTASQAARQYGRRLAQVVVKYGREAERARSVLDAPVTVVRNGIDAFPSIMSPRAERRGVVIGTAARLSPDKKLEQLLAAFRRALPRFPDARLRIAGGPESRFAEYAGDLKRSAEGLPVEWCGDVRDMPAFLRDLDVFAMISEPAGCPNASLEAMASGLPLVATDHGGASEQVIDGVTGILVPRGDVFAFAEALVRVGRDAGLRRTFGEVGREHVRREFSMEEMLARYEALIVGRLEAVCEPEGLATDLGGHPR